MRRTIIAYILNCIEEIEDLSELGNKLRDLEEVIQKELDSKKDELLSVLFLYILLYENDIKLGHEVKNLYNEIKYLYEYTTSA